MLESFEYRYKDPHENKVRCPYCVMGNGPMSSLSVGYDPKMNQYIRSGVRDACGVCNGTGWLDKCQRCGGDGGHPQRSVAAIEAEIAQTKEHLAHLQRELRERSGDA